MIIEVRTTLKCGKTIYKKGLRFSEDNLPEDLKAEVEAGSSSILILEPASIDNSEDRFDSITESAQYEPKPIQKLKAELLASFEEKDKPVLQSKKK